MAKQSIQDILHKICTEEGIPPEAVFLGLLSLLRSSHYMQVGFGGGGDIRTDVGFITDSCNGGKIPRSLADGLAVFAKVNASMEEHNAINHYQHARPMDEVFARDQLAHWQKTLARILDELMEAWEEEGAEARRNFDERRRKDDQDKSD